MTVCLGLDPGLANLGWAVIRDGHKPELLASGAVTTRPTASQDERLHLLAAFVRDLLQDHGPSAMGVEDYVWHGQAKDARTAEVLGVLSAMAFSFDVPIYRCQPQQWRKHIGAGRSTTKADVKLILERRLGWELPNQHAADAAAVGLWAGSQIIGGAHV